MAQTNVSCKKEEAMNMLTSNFEKQPSMMGREENGSRWIPEDHQCKPVSENHCHASSTTMDLHLDTKIHLCSPPMNNFLLGGQQQFPSSFFKGWTESIMFDEAASASISSVKCEYPETIVLDQSLMSTTASFHPVKNKDPIKHETAQADHSVSNCSDQIGNNDHKVVGRRHGSKNLGAERRRRKKINDGLYTLRSLVPNITKLDKASILGDAIEFVKELQAQVKDLEDELEEPSSSGVKNNSNNVQLEEPNQNWVSHCVDPSDHEECLNGSKMGIINCGAICTSNGENCDPSKLTQDTVIVYEDDHDKAQQMEIQVKVTQIDGNEFCIEILCKHKPHGFVRLMKAIDSLGLVVTNANITTFRGLVLNVFKVERKDNEMVEAEHVRDLLLKLMCNPIGT